MNWEAAERLRHLVSVKPRIKNLPTQGSALRGVDVSSVGLNNFGVVDNWIAALVGER